MSVGMSTGRLLDPPPSDDCLRAIVETLGMVDDRAMVRLACGHRTTVPASRVFNTNPVRCKVCENRSPHTVEGYSHPLINKF